MGSVSITLSLGSRLPFNRGLPFWFGFRSGRRFKQAGIQPQAGNQADVPPNGCDEVQRGETAVGDRHDEAIAQLAFGRIIA